MLGFFEERLYRSAYAHAQGSRVAANLFQIDAQLRRLAARTGADTSGYFRDPYFNAYVLGILDSVTHLFETETRRRVGFVLHENFFVNYLRAKFGCTKEEARHRFAGTVEALSKEGPTAGYADGCADGIALCRGETAKARLFWHLAGRNPARAPLPIRRVADAQDYTTSPFLAVGGQAG